MRTIYLIRHGETVPSFPRRFIGQTEIALTQQGRNQCEDLGKYLQAHSIAHMLCSPLSRCLESAAIIAPYCHCDPKIIPELAEINLGDWEGLTVSEVKQRYPGSYEARGQDFANFRPPQGESFYDLRDRVWPAFTTIAASHVGNLVLLCHAGVIRVLLCQILGIPLDNLFTLEIDHSSYTLLLEKKANYRIKRLSVPL